MQKDDVVWQKSSVEFQLALIIFERTLEGFYDFPYKKPDFEDFVSTITFLIFKILERYLVSGFTSGGFIGPENFRI